METPPYGRISAAVVPVETAAPGNGPALPLPTPPETPHHISATVVLTYLRENVPSQVELGGHSGPYDVPVYLTPGVEYGRVLGDVVRQVKDIWKVVTTT